MQGRSPQPLLRWLLRMAPWQVVMRAATDLSPRDQRQERAAARMTSSPRLRTQGRRVRSRLGEPESYASPASPLAIARRVLAGDVEPGFQTPRPRLRKRPRARLRRVRPRGPRMSTPPRGGHRRGCASVAALSSSRGRARRAYSDRLPAGLAVGGKGASGAVRRRIEEPASTCGWGGTRTPFASCGILRGARPRSRAIRDCGLARCVCPASLIGVRSIADGRWVPWKVVFPPSEGIPAPSG